MSKRDRAARAKGENDAAEAVSDELEVGDELDANASEDTDSAELRPQGKRSSRRRSASTTTTDDEATDAGGVAVKERKKKAPEESRNPFVRIWLFLQQVVAELKKVIWPTRREMITYTIVVLLFVVVMTAFISGIDLVFAKGVLWLFG